ncbi:MAG TPA: DUF5069 domain-containing protein [Nitrospiraceae bacterium]|nr:DUF5069 domain-containing protein [Nitrospiraceae bacterium]
MTAIDLRIQFPRSIRQRLAGYVHLGRMIDKCRALQAGMQGDYIYPCPLDEQLLQFAGISSEEFLREVRDKTDREMAEWFRTTATVHTPLEIESWNDMMLTIGPNTEDKWSYFKKTRDAIDPHRTDITTWADLLDLEEKRAVPLRVGAATGGRG